ncbi:DUF3558 domain-containing protein [Nocardia cyriacigeorgica]|uniref:DUF3558 domain-containing protein n=2 Tax=Nocardia cyriacigeorgica TaxID=135487 RepID=A0A5R8PHV6_9NOCA|nr:DUF3558 domain-containing protein [Nocardia cyriacigeorgica]
MPLDTGRTLLDNRGGPAPTSSSAMPSKMSGTEYHVDASYTTNGQLGSWTGAVVGRRTTAAGAVLAVALAAATGCDATNDGTATPASTTAKTTATEALWDPCTQIGEDTLAQVGVDSSTKDTTISGVENVEGWKLCSWHNKPSRWDYTVGVWSTVHALDEIKKDPNNTGFTDISAAGRSGVQFGKAHDAAYDSVCYLGFPFSGGTIEISVYNSPASDTAQDPCDTAKAAAETLVPLFPK